MDFSFITLFHILLITFFYYFIYGCIYCMLLFNCVNYIFFIFMFMYSYCYVCYILCILFHCVILSTVCVYMCTVLLPPVANPIAVNKYVIYEKSCRGLICAEILKKISNISEFLLFGLRFITVSSRIWNMSVILQARSLAVGLNRPRLIPTSNSNLPTLFDIQSFNTVFKSHILLFMSES
jgi:hypothetical protein